MDQVWQIIGHNEGVQFGDFNTNWLAFGQALVLVDTSYEDVGVYVLSDECSICPFTRALRAKGGQNHTLTVDATHQTTWRVMNSGSLEEIPRNYRSGLLCEMRPTIAERGVYNLDIGRCELRPEFEPNNTYNPLLIFGGLLLLAMAAYCVVRQIRRRSAQDKDSCFDLEADVHLSSLYAFRGFLVALLIAVTSGGGGYTAVTAARRGVTLAELLYQCYVWSVGVKIPSTVDGGYARGQNKWMLLKGIFKRSFALFVVGMAIDSTVHSSRFVNPLWLPMQRISVAYFVCASVYALTVKKFVVKSKSILSKALADFVSLLWCWVLGLFCVMLLVICIIALVSFNCQWNIPLDYPVDRYPLPVVEQNYSSCEAAPARDVNVVLTGVRTPFYLNEYFVISKGFMGVVSTIVQCFVGIKTGAVYRQHASHGARLRLWAAWGGVFALGAAVFAGSSKPFQINLWPIASILLTSTASSVMLTLAYVLLEMPRSCSCVLLKRVGTTSLLVLSGHLLFCHSLPFYWSVHFASHFEFLAQNLWTVCLWFAIASIMARKGVRFPV